MRHAAGGSWPKSTRVSVTVDINQHHSHAASCCTLLFACMHLRCTRVRFLPLLLPLCPSLVPPPPPSKVSPVVIHFNMPPALFCLPPIMSRCRLDTNAASCRLDGGFQPGPIKLRLCAAGNHAGGPAQNEISEHDNDTDGRNVPDDESGEWPAAPGLRRGKTPRLVGYYSVSVSGW
jgi:hypothetical protein